MSSKGHSLPSNITETTSPKSLSSMPRIQKMSSYALSTPGNIALSTSPKPSFKTEGRLLVHRAIHLLKTSLPLLRTNRFLECPVYRKSFRIAFRHHVTSLNRHHQSRILRCSEDRVCVLWAIRLIKTSLKRLHPSRFFRFPRMQKMN
jgi:hypothetical protein